MRVLIEGRNLEHYLAKCHEAFRTGLRALFDTRHFGKGYPGYWPLGTFIKDYAQIIDRTFPDAQPDILIAHFNYRPELRRFGYGGLADVNCTKAIILGDYWNVAEHYRNEYADIVKDNNIDYVLTYFPQAIEVWAHSGIAERFVYLPPSFDPAIFNDWQSVKQYDVGFLAAGTVRYSAFYPERFNIHNRLKSLDRIDYLWSPHPGWRMRRSGHPLVGRNFSRAINSCRMFITTGGIHKTAHAKYVEILASKTLLLAEKPVGWERIGLQDGVNYVEITEENAIEKIDYYLARPDLSAEIAEAGFQTALTLHTCYQRALDFYKAVNGGGGSLMAGAFSETD
jgi:hypothetical protein